MDKINILHLFVRDRISIPVLNMRDGISIVEFILKHGKASYHCNIEEKDIFCISPSLAQYPVYGVYFQTIKTIRNGSMSDQATTGKLAWVPYFFPHKINFPLETQFWLNDPRLYRVLPISMTMIKHSLFKYLKTCGMLL